MKVTNERPVRDSNTGLILRRDEGYPDYPNRPRSAELADQYKHTG
jgi:hypothetical protein